MRFSRLAWITGCIVLLIALTACSDVFRPIAIPVFNPAGDPKVTQRVAVLNNNNGGAGGPGSLMIEDSVADAVLAVVAIGKNPVHAASFATQTWIANRGDDTVSAVNNFGGAGTAATTINLPVGSLPQFALAADANTTYIANGNNTISSIATALLAVSKTVPTGTNPVALVETPDFKKVYSINQGSNDVWVFNSDLSPAVVPTIAVGATPIAGALNADGSRLFVLNQGSHDITVIDTSTDSVVTTVAVGSTANPGPVAMIFDNSLRRVYVVNKNENTVSVFKADSGTPTLLKNVTLTGTAPVAITALANGTRVYVANSTSNNVSVIDTASNTETKIIAVGTNPTSITSGGGSLRVVVANTGSNNITDIQTSNDTVIATIATSAPNPGFVVALQ